MPLLCFLATHFYCQGFSCLTAFAVAIALLIQNSTYAAVIGSAFFVFYAFQLVFRWKQISSGDRKKFLLATAIVAFSLILAVIVLFPRSDSYLVARAISKPLQLKFQLAGEGLVGAFADCSWVAIALLILAGIWAYEFGGLLLLILSVGGSVFMYGFVQGDRHHQGLITIAFLLSLWAVWPSEEELENLAHKRRWLHKVLVVALALTFGWACTWSYSAIHNDWESPYTGARDAAKFLKSVHADKLGCNGYLFWALGVQPYFDHNIFLNYGGPNSPASYHFSIDFDKHVSTITEWEMRNGPPFVLVAPPGQSLQESIPTIEAMRSVNYVLVHYSDGTPFFKDIKAPHSLYLVFEKADFALSEKKP